MKSLIAAVIALSCSMSGLAQTPSPSTSAQEVTLNEQTRREVIEAALSALNKNYVFPETAKKMETAIRQRMDRGAYDRITDPQQFAQMLEGHLQEVSRDKHLLIFYRSSIRVAHAAAVRNAIEQGADRARKQELQDLLMELELPTKPAPSDAGGLRLPKTPAGDAMRFFLLALNSGDIGRLRHFHRTQGADVSFGRRDYERLFQPSGGLKTRSIVKSSDYRLEVLAQFKKENTWKKLSVEVETIAPHRVKKIGIDNTESPAK